MESGGVAHAPCTPFGCGCGMVVSTVGTLRGPGCRTVGTVGHAAWPGLPHRGHGGHTACPRLPTRARWAHCVSPVAHACTVGTLRVPGCPRVHGGHAARAGLPHRGHGGAANGRARFAAVAGWGVPVRGW